MIQVKAEGGDCKPPCKLTGTDGNVFAIIGRVREAPRAGRPPPRHDGDAGHGPVRVQIPPAIIERVLRGEVTLAFRRWIRPTVKAGDELRTLTGVVHVETVTRIDESDIGEEEAHRAGCPSRAELLRELHAGRPGWVYRIEVSAERVAPGRPSTGPAENRG